MTAERILQSDVLDILFENRNKLYGAYELRRSYPQRIKKAIGFVFLSLSLAGAAFVLGSRNNNAQLLPIDIEDTLIITGLKPPEKIKPEQPKPAAQPPAPPNVATVKNVTPVIVHDLQVPKPEVPTQEQIDTSASGTRNTPGEGVTGGENVSVRPGTEGGKPGGTSESAPSEPPLPTGPVEMNMVDQMPEYPGGKMALVRYMVNNLTSELEPGVKYVVRAQFVINEEGQVSEVVILSSDEAGLNPQVLKALRKMKTWKPGMMNGRKVAVRFVIPVTFAGPEE